MSKQSFGEAFAEAREEQGAGGTFTYGGNEFTTDRADDLPSASTNNDNGAIESINDNLPATSVADTDNTLSKESTDQTFNEAFAEAREEQGAGGTFTHDGKEFTTDRADDLPSNPTNNNDSTKTPDSTNTTESVGNLLENENTNKTFAEAFAEARKEQGAGGIFSHNGNEYSTNTAEDVSGTKPKSSNPAPNNTDQPSNDKANDNDAAPMKATAISQNGINFIKNAESKDAENPELQAYLDVGQVPTIGYGHTKGLTKEDVGKKTITPEEANNFLKEDLKDAENAINQNVKTQITQNQRDALCSFIHNIGPQAFKNSTMLKKINENKFDEAAREFEVWNKVKKNGKIEKCEGLTNRRKRERELFENKVSLL